MNFTVTLSRDEFENTFDVLVMEIVAGGPEGSIKYSVQLCNNPTIQPCVHVP